MSFASLWFFLGVVVEGGVVGAARKTPEIRGGRFWCDFCGVGEGGVCGCWDEMDRATGYRVWFSGQRWYRVFLEHDVYSLHSKPTMMDKSTIKYIQMIGITNLKSCF